jgi:hypothetical protein
LSGIRARLLLLVLLAIGPFFLLTMFQGIEQRRRAATRERTDARRLALLFAAEHNRVVADARQILFVLAQSPAVRRADAAACTRMFRDILAVSAHFGNFILADTDGAVVASAYPGALDTEDRALLATAEGATFAARRRAGTDLAARYGGEEFAVLLPATDLETAHATAERIRRLVAETPLGTRRGPLAVTVSAGVAILREDAADVAALFDAADAALYAAKAAGRNRVAVASKPEH